VTLRYERLPVNGALRLDALSERCKDSACKGVIVNTEPPVSGCKEDSCSRSTGRKALRNNNIEYWEFAAVVKAPLHLGFFLTI
jgi:hypothetical protein